MILNKKNKNIEHGLCVNDVIRRPTGPGRAVKPGEVWLEPMVEPRTGGSVGDLPLPRGGVRLTGSKIVRPVPGGLTRSG
jgi:hypothetical protein